ncbi:hypothetical protein P0R31_36240 [Bradyrhizobium yuanmingense]|uniref:hypothetical protein n=1 Tax=Bradyrhizobium yuanmingense TaxID=108015 RepID=UPI0023B99B57|nr:hypothetical protein [Bradyrhizobium yuanmingense]MDF0522692.1 hypothetical protein [Bradyrhizobium yuanmingense]
MLDAGLGATPSEIFDIRIHGLPGTRSPKQAWPEPDFRPEMPLDPTLQELVDAGRIDRCGAVTIAGRSLGVPSTRPPRPRSRWHRLARLRDGGFFDLADVTLANCRRATRRRHALARPGILPFLLARNEY